jgi:ABC-type multidrug transport system fused ATPase/permease subunit
MEERKNYAAILVAAVRAPFRDPDWIKKILIGGLLSPLPVVNFLTWGYTYRIFIDGLNGAPELLLPAWQDWRSFFRVGFWIFLITLGYVVLAAFGIIAVISLTRGGISGDLQTLTLVALGSVAVFHTISPVVFTRFAEEGRVWACFEPDAIWRDLRRVVRFDYIQLCFLFYGLWTMTLIVFGGLPIIGIPLVSVTQFFFTLVFSHVFGALIGARKQDPAKIVGNLDE